MAWVGCGEVPEASRARPATGATSAQVFDDRTDEAGLEFTYRNGRTGRHYLLEVMGGGAALFDVDNDGDLDLYAVQGTRLDDSRDPLDPVAPIGDRLYRNDRSEPGGVRFTDVTHESGIHGSGIHQLGYGMGVAAGDVDNDGWVDLYVTRWGANRLLHNHGVSVEGTVTFTDVTEEAGVVEEGWSVAAVFFDYDRDGWLDLYVGNYVDFRLETHKVCIGFGASEDYCGPAAYPAQSDRLWRNLGPDPEGNVTFADVTTEAGFRGESAPGLGAVAADFDGDGWLDLYVANDQADNQLWIHRGDGTFTDEALLAGCAVSGEGKAEASMGVTAADFDGDGDVDLFLSHLTGESNTLYLNDGTGSFDDATIRAGLEAGSWGVTGFGVAEIDFDLDGWLDLAVVNGAVHRIEELHRRGDPYPLHQPNQLYRNLGNGAFEKIAPTPPAFQMSEVSRGLAAGDVDNDGAGDLVMVNNSGRLRLLINAAATDRRWLGVRLLTREGRDALGARAALHRPGLPTLWRRVHTDGSYASASDPRVLFGLGDSTAGTRLVVHWLDGSVEAWEEFGVDRYLTLRQGSGELLK